MEKYQKALDRFFKKNKWSYWSELSILARLTEEVGEFARLVNHLYGDKKKKLDEPGQNLEEEIGDILYTLICFANAHNLSLDRAIQMSLNKSNRRDKHRFKK